jgi:3-carboxy-cis,cis-muconate cycloisomerase
MSTVIDSRIFRNLFGTQEARDIFSDDAYTRRLIHVETALAKAEARAGVIPEASAKAIAAGCSIDKIE